MKIGFLTELFPPSTGGQEERFAALARFMAQRGHQVTVICIRHAAALAVEEQLDCGVTVIRQPLVTRYTRPYGGRLPRSPLGMLRYAMAVRRLTKREEFDVLFLNQWPLLHILALSARNRARSVVDWCEIRSSLPYRILQAVLPKLVAANTAVSTKVGHHVRDHVTDGRVVVLPSGISSELYRGDAAESRRGILYLGRISPHKNLPLLIETFEELCRRGCEDRLIIAGVGPGLDALRRRAAASPMADRIDLLGHVSEERKYAELAAARLLMMTSQREGFPRVVAEAMASRLPVVTARYPQNGTVSVVEEFNCGLCADPNPSDLADAAQAVLRDWDTWSARAHLPTPRLDWVSLAQQFEALLSETAAAAGSQSLFHKTQGASCVSW